MRKGHFAALFLHGKDITIPQGTEITAFAEGDMHLDIARFSGARPAAVAASGPTASSQANLAVESTPPGTDIEVDGAFACSTPSMIAIVAGTHEITIKKKGFAPWTRKMNISGNNVHLNAELEQAAAQ
jgi:hypothetical protein